MRQNECTSRWYISNNLRIKGHKPLDLNTQRSKNGSKSPSVYVYHYPLQYITHILGLSQVNNYNYKYTDPVLKVMKCSKPFDPMNRFWFDLT